MHANRQKPCLHWTALALLATSALTSGGCAKFFHIWHYNHLNRTIHEEHRLSYYHSPHTGRIIPKEHHSVPMVEFPCFGYESTCWHRWPEECGPCPVQGPEGMLMDGPYHGQIIEEVIEQPRAQGSPEGSLPEGPVAPPPADDLPAGDGLPGAGLLDDGLPGDLPTSPMPDDTSFVPRAADDRRPPMPREDQAASAPSDATQPDVDELTATPEGLEPSESESQQPSDLVERDEATVDALASPSAEPAERTSESRDAADGTGPTFVENSFVRQPASGEAETATGDTGRDRSAGPATPATPVPSASAHVPPSAPTARPVKPYPSRRVAQRSSRRVRPSREASRPALAAPSAPATQPAAVHEQPAPVDVPAVSQNVPSSEGGSPSEPAAPTASPSVSARPVVASNPRPSTVAAVHRSNTSRRPNDSAKTLPTFTIVPVVADANNTIVTPLQIVPGPGNSLRFVSDEPRSETRVAEQSTAGETTIRFR